MKRPVLYIAVFFSLGIISCHLFKTPFLYPFLLALISVSVSILYLRNKTLSHAGLYLAVFFVGMVCYQQSNVLPGDHISKFASEEPRKISVKGMIVDDPVIAETSYGKEKTSFVLKVNAVKENDRWLMASGLTQVNVYSKDIKPFNFGDEAALEGFISKPAGLKNPGLFDYSKYASLKNIYSVLRVRDGNAVEIIGGAASSPVKRMAYRLRSGIRSAIDRYLDAPYSGFLKAIIIGDRADLKYDLKEDFIKTGTVHILAISGLHVGLIATLLLALFGTLRIPKKINLILTVGCLIFYSFTAGANPPIIRAVVMFAILALGYLINRDADTLNSLSMAAFLILLWNPKEIFDPGFQLSFISVASIIIFTPGINRVFNIDIAHKRSFLDRVKTYFFKGASVSIAAWLGAWPVVSLYFNIISPAAIIANLVVIPTLFLLMTLSFAFIFASLISSALAGILSWTVTTVMGVLFYTNHILSILPLAYFRTSAPSGWFFAAYYALIFLLILPGSVEFGRIKIRKPALLIIIMLFFNILIWRADFSVGRDILKITFLDVGQGDSALVEFPGGGNMLIDAGSGGDEERFDAGRSVVAPYLWNKGISAIDALVVTHLHEDHLGGVIYILKNFSVGVVIDGGSIAEDSVVYDTYRRLIIKKGLRRISVGDGDTLGPFRDVKIFVLNPEKGKGSSGSNDDSIVLKIAYKNFSALFCGDIMSAAMERIKKEHNKFLKSDVMKIPHHAANLGDERIVKDFFTTVSPKISVISVAKINKYRAPSSKTLDVITSLNSISYKTSENGAIFLSAYPGSFEIKPYLNNN